VGISIGVETYKRAGPMSRGPCDHRNGVAAISLDDAPDAYELFKRKEDGCVKVVLKP